VNILREDQAGLALQFARPAPDKFDGVAVREDEHSVPLMLDALAHLQCTVVRPVDAATHTVFFADVRSARAVGGAPLTYFRGNFGGFQRAA
jgi:flavin reductase (DIM6/NTAB) family NADH-FMN oxidoreductase RutF